MFVTFSDSFGNQIRFLTLELDRVHTMDYSLECLQVGLVEKISSKKSLISLINKLKRTGLRLHPCLSPIVVGNVSVKPFCNCTLDLVLLYKLYNKFINLLLIL